jgi:hypothetical protein
MEHLQFGINNKGIPTGGDMLVYDNQIAPINPGTTWEVVGSVDLNNDQKDDLIWRNDTIGQFATWITDGKKITTDKQTATSPIIHIVPGWKVYGVYQSTTQKRTNEYTLQWIYTPNKTIKAEWYMKGSTFKSGATEPSKAIVNVDHVMINR